MLAITGIIAAAGLIGLECQKSKGNGFQGIVIFGVQLFVVLVWIIVNIFV